MKGLRWRRAGAAVVLFTATLVPSSRAFSEPPALVLAVRSLEGGYFPVVSPGGETKPVTDLVFEGLAQRNLLTNEWEPRLAKRWKVAPDHLSIDFELDPEARFSDGTPVSANDVQFSFEMLRRDGLDTEPWKTMYRFVKSVDVTGPGKVKIALRTVSFRNFDRVADFRVVSKAHTMKILESAKDSRNALGGASSMGSGPWRIIRAAPGEVELGRRADYWGRGNVQFFPADVFERRIYRVVADGAAEWEQFRLGRLSMVILTPQQWKENVLPLKSPTPFLAVKVQNKIPKAFQHIGWNVQTPLLAKAATRLALSRLIDLTEWCDGYGPDMAEPARGFFETGNIGSRNSPRTAANALRREPPAKRPLRLIYSAAEATPGLGRFQDIARRAGVEIVLEKLSDDDFRLRLDRRDFDAFLMTSERGEGFAARQFLHSSELGKGNFTGWSSKEMDRLLDRFEAEFDSAKRETPGRKIDGLVDAEQPHTTLCQPRYTYYAVQPGIRTPRPSFPWRIGIALWGPKKH